MSQQLELFGSGESKPLPNNLFLALMPDRSTAERIVEFAFNLRERHGLTGKVLRLDHLHITLHYLGECSDVPESVVQSIGQACEAAAARTTAFDVTLDSIITFPNRRERKPLVLLANEGQNTALMKLHQVLLPELALRGRLNRKHTEFSPHLTLVYDRKSLAREPVIPITWKADEIALILSEAGKSIYHILGRWKLGAP